VLRSSLSFLVDVCLEEPAVEAPRVAAPWSPPSSEAWGEVARVPASDSEHSRQLLNSDYLSRPQLWRGRLFTEFHIRCYLRRHTRGDRRGLEDRDDLA
jgi:hypothetical protein